MISQADSAAIKEIRRRSALTLNQGRNCLTIIKDCAALSSGTLATLTGHSDYETLDMIHADFITYVKTMAPLPGYQFKTWVEAWQGFLHGHPDYASLRASWIAKP